MLKLPGVFAVELLGAGLERSALFTMASDDEAWVDRLAEELVEEIRENRDGIENGLRKIDEAWYLSLIHI